MPAPTMAPTPSTTTSNVPRLRRSLCVSSSVLASVSSIVLRGPSNRVAPAAMAPALPRGTAGQANASDQRCAARSRPSSRLYFSR